MNVGDLRFNYQPFIFYTFVAQDADVYAVRATSITQKGDKFKWATALGKVPWQVGTYLSVDWGYPTEAEARIAFEIDIQAEIERFNRNLVALQTILEISAAKHATE